MTKSKFASQQFAFVKSVTAVGKPTAIGVGDGGQGGTCAVPPKIGGEYFLGNYDVKFGYFVNFSYTFSGKNVPPKVD